MNRCVVCEYWSQNLHASYSSFFEPFRLCHSLLAFLGLDLLSLPTSSVSPASSSTYPTLIARMWACMCTCVCTSVHPFISVSLISSPGSYFLCSTSDLIFRFSFPASFQVWSLSCMRTSGYPRSLSLSELLEDESSPVQSAVVYLGRWDHRIMSNSVYECTIWI